MTGDPTTALVLGASGQVGTFLLRHLSAQGQRVVAVGRSAEPRPPAAWTLAGVNGPIDRRSVDYCDDAGVRRLVAEEQPDAVYVLCGQSSVHQSFEAPAETIRSHVLPILNVLEAMRVVRPAAKVVYASSTECFGSPSGIADESAAFDPRSPYAAGKVAGSTIVRSYRESFGMACSSAFMSNHESALRSERFVFGKVLAGIDRIQSGEAHSVTTGPLGVNRDWGYAPEFAEAIAAMATSGCDTDLVVATGRTVLLRDAVHGLFRAFGLDPARHLIETQVSLAPASVDLQHWSPQRAREKIGWQAQTWFPELAASLREDWLAYRAIEREAGGPVL